jgi:TonB family protein
MHRIKKYFSLALVTLLIGSVTGAQTNSPEVIPVSEFFRMLSNQPDSSTDWTFILDEASFGIKAKYRLTIARKQGKVRREMYPLENETSLKNKADKNYKLVVLDHPGRPSVAFDPQAKTYAEMPGVFKAPGFDLESFIQSKASALDKIKVENVGVENFKGHPSTKIRMTFEGEGGEVFMYFANDMKNLLIGMELTEAGKSSLTISNILFDLPDELFEIPQGYKKVDLNSFQAVLKQKVPASRPSKNKSIPAVEPGPPPMELRPPIVAKPDSATSSNATVATDVDSPPVLLKMPKPEYTQEAQENQVQGVVRLQILIGADGNVKRVRVLGGLPDGLVEKAIKAAHQRKYKPAMKDGKPVSYEMKIEIEFKLDSK